MNRLLACLLTLSLFASACQILSQPPTPTPKPELVNLDSIAWDDHSIFEEGLATSARSILGGMEGTSVYHLEFDIADDMYHIGGREKIYYTNNEAVPLNEIEFRLFPNILGGEMLINSIQVDGLDCAPEFRLEKSLLVVSLPTPLDPGKSAVIEMDFDVTVPQRTELNYGVLAYYDNILALAHAYPMIAVYDDEGWNAEIPPQAGDVTYADASFFIVRVDAPEEVVLAASGREVNRVNGNGRQSVVFAAGPARDFYLAASSDYKVYTRQSGEVILRFYAPQSLRDGAEDALDVAEQALNSYDLRYAPYPYSELDFVSTPTLALGVEYPGMIAISDRIIQPDTTYLEATVAHEAGHQWFYNLVGNDQLDDPWLDESLTQYVTLQYFTDEYGPAGNEGFRQDLERRWARVDNAPIPIGLSVASYSKAEYSAIVYGRGALFFEALREEIGRDAFDAFMKDYVQTYAWDIATPDGLKATAEEHCRCDLTPLFQEWIYR
jgi:hypothetical protein